MAQILLVCGCSVIRRDVPRNLRHTFICESNMGHGYRGQAWLSWEFSGRTGTNTMAEVPS